MVVTRFLPLDPPVIDPRNDQELLNRAIDRCFVASGGRLNSFSAGDPIRAFYEGMIVAEAELLYRLNLLPEAFAIEFFKINGIMRRLGSASVVTLTFTLQQALSTSFQVPQGFYCQTSNKIGFTTNQPLIIPAGFVSGSVSATCTQIGKIGNVSAYTIAQFIVPLAYLKSVINPEAATGGTDAETLNETKARAFASLRRRGLVSQDDYEQEAVSFLGEGAVAHAIGNLGADKIAYEKGSCHVFVLNSDGSELSEAQLSALLAQLSTKAHIGVNTFVSNVDIVLVDMYVTAELVPGTDPATIAGAINTRLTDYLKPGVLSLGETVLIKELEFQVRLAGVSTVQSVLIGDPLSQLYATNYALPFQYSAAKLNGLRVDLVLGTNSFTYFYGEGDND